MPPTVLLLDFSKCIELQRDICDSENVKKKNEFTIGGALYYLNGLHCSFREQTQGEALLLQLIKSTAEGLP